MQFLLIFLAAAALTFIGERLMRRQLQRQQALLAEWGEVVSLPVCKPWLLFLLTAVCLWLGWRLPVALAGKLLGCVFLYLLLLIGIIDGRCRFIFDDSNIILGILGLLATPFLPASLPEQAGGAVIGFVIMFVLSMLGRGVMGGGDIKLVAILGWWLGMYALPTLLCVGFMLGGVGAVCVLLFTKKGRKDTFAFGPYLIFGAVLAWLLQAGRWG